MSCLSVRAVSRQFDALGEIPILRILLYQYFFNWLLKFIWEYYMTRWFFNNALVQYALWSNGRQASSDWQHSDPMAYWHHQIDSTLIQWRTGIIRLTALWSNGRQASSDWQHSDPMAYWHHQIDSTLIQWRTGIIRLTALWSNGIQASSDWQHSDPMADRHRQIDSTLIQWRTGIIRLTALWSNGVLASSDWQSSDPMAYKHRQIDSALIQWCWGSRGGGKSYFRVTVPLLFTTLLKYMRSLAPLQLVAP